MRCILTDLGNVVTKFRFRAQVLKEITEAFGVSNIQLPEIFGTKSTISIGNEDYYHGLDTGEFSVYEMWKHLIVHGCLSQNQCPYPLFLSLWCRHLVPIEETVNLYCQLQERFPIIAVSNGDSEGVRHLIYYLKGAYGLKFGAVFISAEYKRKKPGLLKYVVELLESQKVKPSECVFVDDLLPYVEAARLFGIPAVHFNGVNQKADELANALAEMGFVQ